MSNASTGSAITACSILAHEVVPSRSGPNPVRGRQTAGTGA